MNPKPGSINAPNVIIAGGKTNHHLQSDHPKKRCGKINDLLEGKKFYEKDTGWHG